MDEKAMPEVGQYRSLTKRWQMLSAGFTVIGLVLALIYIFNLTPFGYVPLDFTFAYVLLAMFLPLCFIWLPPSKKAARYIVPWYDILLSFMSLAIPAYFVSQQNAMLGEGWGFGGAPPTAIACSIVFWLLMPEAARRAAGPVFAAVVLFFSFYPLFAPYMPGLLLGPSFRLDLVAAFHVLGEEGIVGIPMVIFSRLLLAYMTYSVVLMKLGAGEFFMNLASAVVGKTRGGTAKIAIVASALFGSISGSAMANVMTTGCITIPAMKKSGLPAHFAGAVEAAASSGGGLMPPIMGVTAFMIAEFIQVSYTEVVIAAAVPAILYFVCLFAQIDSFSARIGLKPPPITVEAPSVWRTLLNNLHIVLSLLLLILVLFFLRMTAQAPWYAAGLAIVLAMFSKRARINLRSFFDLLVEVGKVLGMLVGIMAPVGLILGALVLTGIAHSLPHAVVALAQGNLYVMLLLGAIASFILGMGLTTAAVYILLAIILAPGLVSAGFDIMGVHLFVLYCGIWSAITPPVALAAFVAASISGASPMRTGVQAMKLGVAKYVLPFAFVLSPALILHATPLEILRQVFTALIGLIIISGALEGYFWRIGHLTMVSRVLFLAPGLLLLLPVGEVSFDLYGIGAFLVIFGLSYLLRGRSPLAKVLVHQTQSETDNK